ncbi:MAG: Peptidase [Bacteroidetes bacterium]|nr:Peptidase [Bacteroidota bacterium]
MKKLISIVLIMNGISLMADPIYISGDTVTADKSRIMAHLQFLAGSTQARYDENVKRLDECAAYILTEFKKFSEDVEEQKYMVAGKEYKNVICSFGPRDGTRVIVGAHYDVCEVQPGADDNASGVAGLLEIARMLKNKSSTLKYRIDLVAYTLEEPPNFRTENMGSAVHAKMLHDQHIEVKAMICLEMIGYFSDLPHSQEYPVGIMKLFYPTKANYIAVIGKVGQGRTTRKIKRSMGRNSEVRTISLNAPAFIPGIDFSDHLNYWKYGYVAVMITDTSFYRNANYHEKTDTISTLNIDKMAEVIRGVFGAIMQIAD